MRLLNESERVGRIHLAILFFAWSAWFLGFYSLTVFSFLLPGVKTELRPTDLQLAWLTGIAIGASGVGGFLFGALSDRIGRRASTAAAIVTFVAGNAACALATGSWWLAAARGVAGLGIGGTWGAGQAMIGETFPPALRGRFGAVAQSGAPLGLGLGTILGSFAGVALGWRTIFGISTAPILLLAFLPAVPESDVWRAQAGTRSIAREIVRGPTAWSFFRCLLLTLFNMSNYWFAVAWLPKYLQDQRGLTIARSGWATLCFVAGSLAGYLSFGLVSDKLGRRVSFSLYCFLMAAGLAMFTLFWPTPRLVLVFMAVAGVGTGTWSCYGPMFSEIFPTAVRGTAMSVIMNATRGAQFLTPVVIAAVAPRWGMSGGIALAAGFAVLAAAWVWTLPETRGRAIGPEKR